MFLLSPVLQRKFKFAINTAYFFRVFPYKWNDSTGLINLKSRHSRTWKFVSYAIVFHGLFFTAEYCRILANFTTKKFGDVVVATLFFLAFALSMFLQFFIKIRGNPMVVCCNRFIQYFNALQGKRVAGSTGK